MKTMKVGMAILAGALVAGCGNGEKAKAVDEVAISVNGVDLMQSKIDEDVAAVMKAQGDRIPAEQRDYARQMIANQMVQSFIIEQVMASKAKAEGYTVTDADRKEREGTDDRQFYLNMWDSIQKLSAYADDPNALRLGFRSYGARCAGRPGFWKRVSTASMSAIISAACRRFPSGFRSTRPNWLSSCLKKPAPVC